MKTVLALWGVHAAASTMLFIVMALGCEPASFYSEIFFFLLNIPGVWALKWAGASPLLNKIGLAYGAPLILATTQAIVGVTIYLCVVIKRRLAPNSTIERDARKSGARPSL